MEPTEIIDTTDTTPYRFKITVHDELIGCVRSPKTREETLELLHRDLVKAFGDNYQIAEFEEITDEEWEAAVAEAEIATDFSNPTPRVLN